jgi:hypothetical protein
LYSEGHMTFVQGILLHTNCSMVLKASAEQSDLISMTNYMTLKFLPEGISCISESAYRAFGLNIDDILYESEIMYKVLIK